LNTVIQVGEVAREEVH